MSTKKTTPAKKAPAKKAVFAAKALYRVDYKPGARVKVTRRDGSESKGFVDSIKSTPTGHFIAVNIGSKAAPEIIEARPAKVRGF